ncbi:MAG: glycosyltransferase family 2 protein [Ruminococcaceae bacterium]|nr:glycosyltransferase family 2 protein [Oscillospiraceae bacterium]
MAKTDHDISAEKKEEKEPIKRRLYNTVKKIAHKNRITYLMARSFSCIRCHGFRFFFGMVKRKIQMRKVAHRGVYTTADLNKQRATVFPKKIKFSILVPLYNTPKQYLEEMIQSVLDQTYANWQLCLADGSDGEHSDLEQIVSEVSKNDPRVCYRKLEKNYGISGNTNACIEMADGEYIALFDHDDLLHPAALFEVMRAICEKKADFIYTDENTFTQTPTDAYCPHFKPDFAPDNLRANNYICHFTVFSRELLEKTGGFRPECDGSQDFDMVLRLTEQAKTVVHIPIILYYWRAHKNSVASDVSAKPYVIEAAHRALEDHLCRVGLKGSVEDTCVPSMYRIKYEIESQDKVSIIIPNKDHCNDLKKCLDSIFRVTTYSDYEIIIVENNSEKPETFEYYETLSDNPRVRVVVWESEIKEFNYSALNNFGATFATGKYLVLLNNDTEIITPDWLQEMVMFAQRSDVGAVGVKLYYPDDTVQHAGIGIGLLQLAGHYHRGFPKEHPGYMGRLIYAQDVSAVTAACVMIPRDVWDAVGGLDEKFKVAFNDVDLCMRIRKKGYLIVFTPFAELYHYESKSRGFDDSPKKRARFEGEIARFGKRWEKEMQAGDPYYNPNFTLDREDFSFF